MSDHCIIIHGLEGEVIAPGSTDYSGYLRAYDADAHDGLGSVQVTDDERKAMRFLSVGAAMALINSVPANRPIRDDGRPNRPLTAFSLVIERIGGGRSLEEPS